jgi:anaerobic dimethyl sulfoxide reductase subunit B (iron-sulfur subunit)
MAKTTLRYFKDDCMGCHGCEVACKQEHGLGVGPRLVRVIENSPDFTPVYCHHCASAPCKAACPVEAISRNDQGIVLIDSDLCIGCKDCMEACPFGAMQFDDEHDVAVKCDLCVDRLAQGKAPGPAARYAAPAVFSGAPPKS